MRAVRLHVLTAIVIAMATAGCNDDAKGNAPQAGSASQTASASAAASASPTASASAAAPAGMDDATKAACKKLNQDIEDGRKQIANAEKIGGPAGNYAVSAAWSAAGAALSLHSITANDAVTKAVDDATKAMSEIAEKYMEPKAKPDKTAANRAIDELKKVCAAT